jgi:plasmid stabilization system protein ParE
MPRRSLTYSEAALKDLAGILTYIIESSGMPLTAHAYLDRIRARCNRLRDAPIIGSD